MHASEPLDMITEQVAYSNYDGFGFAVSLSRRPPFRRLASSSLSGHFAFG
jgi:hypothetical protein